MITLLIIICLAWSFYLGYSRGILLQSYYTLASLLSLGIASLNYKALSKVLFMWLPYANATEGTTVNYYQSVDIFDLDKVYYYAAAFFAIYTASYLIFRLLGVLLHFFNGEPYESLLNNSIAGGLSLLVTCFSFVMVFMILAAVPYASIQNALSQNILIDSLIKSFPFLSSYLHGLWTVG
ncbi:CvpA family protein [Streptococcus saliviloxodontae]|uniref:Membrane protein required for colicin V production n=1 Tax=Streptococcus saliviloxodontae TaxID=1349416 RepID=A0ABS2PIP1_9STRE|nr:CvpA family protein [Streptococcus saliviloxodontae]MBM7635298.1 putative membrane protein required for colicin V production [Streptococcus saliviloxodontae]